jgi:UDP-N-acetylmuramoyl-tripeptide--D-alanyl-D-alanine ligase
MHSESWTIGSIATEIDGVLSHAAMADEIVTNFQVKAWSCNSGSCFVPYSYPPLLDGGNEMVRSAIIRGNAKVAIVDSLEAAMADLPTIRVANVNEALARLARSSRDRFAGKLIGITGTAGKSSTKAMLGHLVKLAGSSWVTTSNQNLTPHVLANLASITPDTEYAVMEIGLYQQHTIQESTKASMPHVGLITSIGLNHAASFDDPETGILNAKTDLLRLLAPGATAVLPAFSGRYQELLAHAKQSDKVDRIISCGTDVKCDVRLLEIERTGEQQRATLQVAKKAYIFDVPYLGAHMVQNAALVAGALLALDLPMELMTQLNSAPRPHSAARRYKAEYRNKTFELIDDSFNTGSLALTAMTEHVAGRKAKRKLLIVSDIGGMEDTGYELHATLAGPIDAAGFAHVFTVGPAMQEMAQRLETASSCFLNRFHAVKAMEDMLQDGDLVIIKGSTAMKFKDVIAHIKKGSTLTEADTSWTIEQDEGQV